MALNLRQNFAQGLLASGIAAGDLQVTLSAGHTLPTAVGNFPLVIWDQTTYPDPADDTNLEIVTASYSGTPNVYDIVRAKESTIAVAHAAGDRIALHYTAQMSLDDLANHTHAASAITSGTFADARISQSSVTQYQGSIDHGSIAGLSGDDHSQYHNDARAAVWLAGNHETTYVHSDIALNTAHRGLVVGNPHNVTPAELSLVIGTDVQAHGDVLDDFNTLGAAGSDGEFIVATGAGVFAYESGATARTSIGLGTGDTVQFANFEASNKLTACATNAGALDFSAGSKTLTVSDDATVSGTNTGDQTSIVGITGTKAEFNTACTDGTFMYVGDAPTAHTHDGDTLQHDGVNSDGGAFSFTTTGLVTFNQSIAAANYTATNLLTACATNAGALDFSAGSKTLTVEDDAVVSQDYSSDASPTFTTVDLTGITDGNIPYMSAAGFADSPLSTDATDVRSSGIMQATGFAMTGWPDTPNVTLSFDDATKVFTVTDGGGAYYYINGVKYTLGGNKTFDLDTPGAAEGLWYIYFDGSTLTGSQVIWNIAAGDKALVAYLYWDNTNNKQIFLGYELHGYEMDPATHSRLHSGGGAAWQDGLLVSDAGSEQLNVSSGTLHDEDIQIDITDGAGGGLFEQVLTPAELPIYYRSGASDWRIYETTDKANAVDACYIDGSNDLHYNKLNGTWASTATSTGKHVAYYVVATNEQAHPVVMIMGQRIDSTLAQAKVNNIFSGLSLSGWPFEEAIVLARVIVKDTASGVYYSIEDITDLRTTNITGNVTSPLITDHGGLAGLGDDDHSIYALLAGRTGGQTLYGSDTTSEDLTLGDNSADGNTITVTQAIAAYTHSGLVVGNPHNVTPAELSLVIGTDVQAHGNVLDDFNTLGAAGSDGQFIVATGAGVFAYESGATARTSLGLGTGDTVQFANFESTNKLTACATNAGALDFSAASKTLTVSDDATVSGTNTGDQTSIVGITGTMAQFNTACTDGDFSFGGGGGGHSYVNRDNPATFDFDQIHIDDYITAQNDFHLIDNTSGDFINDGVKVGDWVSNGANYAQVTNVNSGTDLTLDTNIFPDNDGSRYRIWRFNANSIWKELDLSGIIDAGAVLVRVKFRSYTGSANTKFQMRKKGETNDNYSTYMPGIANAEQWGECLVVPDSNGVIEVKTAWSGPPKNVSHYLEFTVVGWWV